MPKKDSEFQEVLKQLASEAKRYAIHMMETTGSVPPTLMALTPEGFIREVHRVWDKPSAPE